MVNLSTCIPTVSPVVLFEHLVELVKVGEAPPHIDGDPGALLAGGSGGGGAAKVGIPAVRRLTCHNQQPPASPTHRLG
jgi:hypothetical protein